MLLWGGSRLFLDNGVEWGPNMYGIGRVPGYEEDSETPNGEAIALQFASYDMDIEEYDEPMNYDFENGSHWFNEEWNAHHDLSKRVFKTPNKDADDSPPMKTCDWGIDDFPRMSQTNTPGASSSSGRGVNMTSHFMRQEQKGKGKQKEQ